MGRQDAETETLIPTNGGVFDVAHSLRVEGFDASEDGTGRGTPLVFDVAPTMDARAGRSGANTFATSGGLVPVQFSAQMSVPQVDIDICQTLGAKNPQAVAFSVCPDHCGGDKSGQEVAFVNAINVSRTLDCTGADVTRKQGGVGIATATQVRRLTPVECERLQGFPDNYTAIPWRKKPASECPDGPRYKALGNSMAVPVMRWIGQRIASVEQIRESQPQAMMGA